MRRKGERGKGAGGFEFTRNSQLAIRNSQLAIRNSQFLLIGLALAHHRTAALLLPGLALYWLWTQPAIFRPQRAWIQWAVALLAPLLLYAYLPIRAAQGVHDLHGDYTNTPAGFLRHVLALGYTNFFAANELSHSRTLLDWVALFRQQMGSGVLLVAILGAILVFNRWRAKRAAAGWILVALVLVTNLIFAVNYQVSDVEVFLLPVFFCIALFFEVGINGALAWLDKALGNAKIVQWLLAILILALLVGSADWQSAWQRANDWSIHDNAVTMATTAFPPNSRVIGLEGEMTALRYLQQSEALGLNAQPINADTAEVRSAAIAESVAQGYPTYITRELPGIETSYDFSGEGVLVRVWRKDTAQLQPLAQSVTIDVAKEKLRLIGYDLHRLDQAGGTAWQLSLDWQAERPIEESLKFSLRWLAADGSPLLLPDGAQGQDEFPLRQVIPTQYWQVGKTMRDVQIVRLPAQLRQSAHTLLLIVYDSATGVELGRWQVDLPG